MKARWYEGVPPVDAVLAHESDHPRPDGVRLGNISVSRAGVDCPQYITTDDRSFGDWVCIHRGSMPYLGMHRLKSCEGQVLTELGFTQWIPLADCSWSDKCSFFPVGINGLPHGFKTPSKPNLKLKRYMRNLEGN